MFKLFAFASKDRNPGLVKSKLHNTQNLDAASHKKAPIDADNKLNYTQKNQKIDQAILINIQSEFQKWLRIFNGDILAIYIF